MSDPVAKYRAIMRKITDNQQEIYDLSEGKHHDLRIKILSACIVASAISNGFEDIKKSLDYGLDLPLDETKLDEKS